jgi:DNA-binding protein H-NS
MIQRKEGNRMQQLKTMSLDQLMALRDKVDALLKSKVVNERRTLEAELSKLTRFNGGAGRTKLGNSRSGTVPPKYRNPDNPSETWAGRGLKPRWLTAAIKAGKKLEHFSIAAPVKKWPAKKSRKASKK